MTAFWISPMAPPESLSRTASSITTGRPRLLATLTATDLRIQLSLSPTLLTGGRTSTLALLPSASVMATFTTMSLTATATALTLVMVCVLYMRLSSFFSPSAGAQLLVENNVWTSPKKPLYSTDEGFAVARGNGRFSLCNCRLWYICQPSFADFGGGENTAPTGTFTTAPYSYSLVSASAVRAAVTGSAGQTLTF